MRPRLIRFVGLLLFVILCGFTLTRIPPQIQSDLYHHTQVVLDEQPVQLDSMRVTGRDLYIYGRAPSLEIADSAVNAVGQIKGTRHIHPYWNIVPPVTAKERFENLLNRHVIEFEAGQFDLLPEHMTAIDSIAFFMFREVGTKLVIGGHTDNSGETSSNQQLSLKRAEIVYSAILRKGISRHRLLIMAFSDTQPLTDNMTPQSRQKNRRISFSVIEES